MPIGCEREAEAGVGAKATISSVPDKEKATVLCVHVKNKLGLLAPLTKQRRSGAQIVLQGISHLHNTNLFANKTEKAMKWALALQDIDANEEGKHLQKRFAFYLNYLSAFPSTLKEKERMS